MAYALDPAVKPDEEEKDGIDGLESQYAALVGPAATTSPSDVATPNAVRAATPSAPGFVSFDRYLNANRNTAERMVNDVAGGMEKKASAVEAGMKAGEGLATDAKNATIQGPAQNQPITPTKPQPTTAAGVQAAYVPPQTPAPGFTSKPINLSRPPPNQPRPTPAPTPTAAPTSNLPPVPYVTAEQVKANAEKGYGGPTQNDVRSAYDKLSGDLTTGSDEAYAAKNGGLRGLLGGSATDFDAALTGAAGGNKFDALKRRFDELNKAYGTSLDTSTKAAAKAEGDSATAKSAWGRLSDTLDTNEANRSAMETADAAKAQATRRNLENSAFDALPMLGPEAEKIRAFLGRLSNAELQKILDAGPGAREQLFRYRDAYPGGY